MFVVLRTSGGESGVRAPGCTAEFSDSGGAT